MDAHEVWQENKRWILGIALGLTVFVVADSIIGGAYSTSTAQRQIRDARKKVSDEDLYTRDALAAARGEQEALQAERDRLDRALLFSPSDDFVLEGKGDPDLHFDQVSRRVKRGIMRRTDALGVSLVEGDLEWASPVGAEIQPTLTALCLLEHAATRLIDAHERVRSWNQEALGLTAIEALQVSAMAKGSRGSRSRRKDDDVVREDSVRFKFRADEATVKLFLESCASVAPPLTLGPDFKMTLGNAAGDPLVVSGTLSALSLP